jgi:predicted N-formylglutamate amidohydrolase
MPAQQPAGFAVVPGDPASPVVLHVPHASTEIPAWVRERLLLDDRALAAELGRMTDARTDVLALAAAGSVPVRPWLFVNRLSRLVVDPERFPDDREEMSAVGMGAVYTRTSHGGPLRPDDPAHATALIDAYFHPYAAALAAVVDGRLAATGRAVIVDVHSYPSEPLPYELHAGGPRPPICLGSDERHTPGWLRAAAEGAFGGFERGWDSPFAGTYVPLAHYGVEPRVASLMVEIRRDVYSTCEGEAKVAEALGGLVAAASQQPRAV